MQQFRNATIKCLTEIAGVNAGNVYDRQFVQLFTGTIIKLSGFMPLDMSAFYSVRLAKLTTTAARQT